MKLQIPQELVDKIIDEIHESPSSLQSCALVAHSFLSQSQMHLFARMELKENSPSSPRRFSDLISASPHLALHVRSLDLECHSENWESVSPILSAVSRLTHLKLVAMKSLYFEPQLPPARAPFPTPFSFSSLRSIELRHYEFHDVDQFRSLLINVVGLESLELTNIVFAHPSMRPAAPRIEPPKAVLSTLNLYNMGRATVTSIMDALDIKHIKTLFVYDTPISPILRRNASSLTNIQISVIEIGSVQFIFDTHIQAMSDAFDAAGPVVLAGLKSLSLDPYIASSLPHLFSHFGGLQCLPNLENVTVSFGHSSEHTYIYPNSWRNFDAMLRVLVEGGSLKTVKVYIGYTDVALPAQLRAWMPSSDAAGVLSIVTPQDFYV
ncbi:hypothetical protein DFH07DRAFT_236345 [Mycena maculata]|uniref:F-box domain-containing protein n=1 Tax=Mycena maculata TaxID=230809 RepID=A0AAD7HRU9_9AGAR|nr:hypothetical protein DFH07DRAFT_236345 [Mycena maculata]